MKKSLFYLFALICSMGVFTGCSDDDPDYTQVIETEIAGGYKGELNVNVDGNDLGSSYQKITVEKAGATAINLYIKDFSFMSIPVGDVELLNCPLSESNGSYTFTGTTTVKVESAGLDASVDAQGTAADGKLSLNLAIKAMLGELEQNVKVTFEGTKLNGTEATGADITSFTFDNKGVSEQPVINADNTITFKVYEGADVTALVPTIVVSEGATVTPATGVAQDFSNGKVVTYTVVSEDYGTTKVYKASVSGSQTVLSFTFDEWKKVGQGLSLHEEPLPDDLLASSVQGASLLFLYGVKGFPVYQEKEDVIAGSAIKLVTMDTSDKTNALVPALTAGSVFTGKFNIGLAISDKLASTQFGIPYDKKPVTLRGWYKYTPGEKYIDGEGAKKPEEVEVIEGQVDECAIQAILYEEQLDSKGNNIPLNGHDINTSDRRVAVAVLSDGSAKADWTKFELPFEMLEGKTYDAGKKYQLAVVCSSSKLGDVFKGAGGSTLMLDELEIIGE